MVQDLASGGKTVPPGIMPFQESRFSDTKGIVSKPDSCSQYLHFDPHERLIGGYKLNFTSPIGSEVCF